MGRIVDGNRDVIVCLLHIAKNDHGRSDINHFLHAARIIQSSMVLAPSIDNFVHTHRESAEITICAKVAILKTIIDAENGSNLLYGVGADDRIQNFESISNTWIVRLWRLLVEGVEKSNIESAFKNVRFVVFNYDRCLEYFLYNALRIYFDVAADKAADIVNKIEIIHPYGVIGLLGWQRGAEKSVDYGDTNISLRPYIGNIKTFTESTIETNTADRIKKLITETDTLVFLGFSFADLNMDLLFTEKQTMLRRVYATAYGISRPDVEIIQQQIRRYRPHFWHSIEVQSELRCNALFDAYYRTLAIGNT